MAAESWEEKNVRIKVASDGQNEGEGKGWMMILVKLAIKTGLSWKLCVIQ